MALEDDSAAVDDRDPVADLFDLPEQMAGVQDRDSFAREARNQRAQISDPGRIEPVCGLVEDQELRLPQQGSGDP